MLPILLSCSRDESVATVPNPPVVVYINKYICPDGHYMYSSREFYYAEVVEISHNPASPSFSKKYKFRDSTVLYTYLKSKNPMVYDSAVVKYSQGTFGHFFFESKDSFFNEASFKVVCSRDSSSRVKYIKVLQGSQYKDTVEYRITRPF